ncbi:hypothetical protein RUM43_003945 [Polyplax serrata]|uniref:Uncharacterized protein n=1 Tax=Polyplax serrata TaxID=468196 RepID=A0AAN8P746_POLSC
MGSGVVVCQCQRWHDRARMLSEEAVEDGTSRHGHTTAVGRIIYRISPINPSDIEKVKVTMVVIRESVS